MGNQAGTIVFEGDHPARQHRETLTPRKVHDESDVNVPWMRSMNECMLLPSCRCFASDHHVNGECWDAVQLLEISPYLTLLICQSVALLRTHEKSDKAPSGIAEDPDPAEQACSISLNHA